MKLVFERSMMIRSVILGHKNFWDVSPTINSNGSVQFRVHLALQRQIDDEVSRDSI